MHEPDDPHLDAVERRLTARAGLAAPAGHRDRVLAAVRDVLDVLAERHAPTSRSTSGIDAGGMAALVAIAVSALVVVVAPCLVASRVTPLRLPKPTLAGRARAVGIDLPVEFVAATPGHPVESIIRSSELPAAPTHEAWQLRTLLTGEL